MTAPLKLVPPDDETMTDAEYARVVQASPESTLPESIAMGRAQTKDARQRIDADISGYAKFSRSRLLRDLLGPFAPGELILFGGRQENGKSLLAQNLADDLISQDITTLYIGLEQSPKELRIKHACLRAGVHPSAILKPTDEFKQSAEYRACRELVLEQLAWLETPDMLAMLIFAPTQRLTREQLGRWTTGGVKKYGVQAVIVDHIDHMDHGDGKNSVHEQTETVHLAKMLAQKHEIPMICLSQIRRPGDALNAFTPPQAHEYAGTSAKERTADIMASIWRPLRTDLPPKELRAMLEAAKMGGYGGPGGDVVYKQGVMGVRKVKDRLGETPGKQVMMHVQKGRLIDPPSRYEEPYGGQA